MSPFDQLWSPQESAVNSPVGESRSCSKVNHVIMSGVAVITANNSENTLTGRYSLKTRRGAYNVASDSYIPITV